MLPNFLVVGAARSGTTSLHYYLAQHPDVCMSDIKEPNFFLFEQTPTGPRPLIADDRRLLAKSVPDRAAYERLFHPGGARAVGEASPLYLYTRETPAVVARTIPQVRCIAVVREPVDRAWSHFVYVNGDLGDQTVPAFEAAVARERPLGYEPYRTGTHFLRLSRYAEQLERYRDTFGGDRVLVVKYDDLVTSPAETLARVCRFLDVDAGFAFDTSVRYNPSTGDRSALGRVDRMIRPALPYLKRTLPKRLVGSLARRRAQLRATRRDESAAPRLPESLRASLADYFRHDLEWLEAEEGIRFTEA